MTPPRVQHLKEVTNRLLDTTHFLHDLTHELIHEEPTDGDMDKLDLTIIRLQGLMIELDDAVEGINWGFV